MPTGTVREVVDEAAAPLFSDVALTKAAAASPSTGDRGLRHASGRDPTEGTLKHALLRRRWPELGSKPEADFTSYQTEHCYAGSPADRSSDAY